MSTVKLFEPALRLLRATASAALIAAVSSVNPIGLLALQTPVSNTAVQEPQFVNQFFQLNPGGTLTPLEQEKFAHQSKTHNYFVAVKTTGESIVPEAASPNRVGPDAHFVVRLDSISDSTDPNTIISLKPFVVEKNQRAIPMSSAKAGFFQPAKGQTAADSSVAITFKRYGESSYEVTPATPLPLGEYVLMTLNGVRGVSCFGVDAAGAESQAPKSSSNSSDQPGKASLTARKPHHPASTVVDLPPGAPGYPPLHASAAAPDGCWWTPFVSESHGLEMLVQQCEPGKAPGGELATFGDTDQGIASITPKGNHITELFTVITKPATQPVTAAIQKQFISKLNVPAARTSCKPIRDAKNAGPGENYTIVATGPYSKLKKFTSEEMSDDPCPGLGSDDVTGRSFLYLPAESKTKYIFFQIQESWPFDQSSIHFLPESQNGAN